MASNSNNYNGNKIKFSLKNNDIINEKYKEFL